MTRTHVMPKKITMTRLSGGMYTVHVHYLKQDLYNHVLYCMCMCVTPL